MSKTTKKTTTTNGAKRNGRVQVDMVSETDIFAALFMQDIAVRTEQDSRTLNNGIAKQLRKGAAMIPGYEFDWESRMVKKAG